MAPDPTRTFLFTDIEGSTRLWEEHPQAMRQAHARHGAIVAACVARHAGTLVRSRGEGDSTFSHFADPADALAAVVALQCALATEDWPAGAALRVRAALHTGPAVSRDGDFNSTAVNRCARLRALAYGGQTLLSRTVREGVGERLPAGVTLQDLGLHRLKDLQQPEQVFAVVHPDLPADFPPLRSLDALPTNLPRQVSSFIGREREMAAVRHLLSASRLLTLTGSGGCGKTRLALQVAAELVEEYAHGVWFVDLAALSSEGLVEGAVASALGVREQPGRTLRETLTEYLRPLSLLLVLDNCEHLVEACARLADHLLRACPDLRILATSREALDPTGETPSWRVPSLPTPRATATVCADALMQYEAPRLFVERARGLSAGFEVTDRNAPALARICHRLDGIPLAVELAAARVRAMNVEQIAERLNDRFHLLTGGSRTALPRQQTLRATIDWSYSLLTETERTLLARVSVFAGGWTLEAAEVICSGEGIESWEVLDLLTSLVDKSLVIYEEQEDQARYRLLETVRQYGQERLGETGQRKNLHARHGSFFLELAEEGAPKLRGPEQGVWLDRLEAEHENLRFALDACQEDGRAARTGLRIAGAVWRFWLIRGYWSEGREGLTHALANTETAEPTRERAEALNGAAALAQFQGDNHAARAHYAESLSIYRELQNTSDVARLLYNMGLLAAQEGAFKEAEGLFTEGLQRYRELNDREGIAAMLHVLGWLATVQGDYVRAHPVLNESLTLYRSLGIQEGIAESLSHLGDAALQANDYSEAIRLYEEALALFRELGNSHAISGALYNLGIAACKQGDYTLARSLQKESLTMQQEMGYMNGIILSLEAYAYVAVEEERAEPAARLFGAAEALRNACGTHIRPFEKSEYDYSVSRVCAALGETAFRTAWAEGRAMTLEQAVTYALAEG